MCNLFQWQATFHFWKVVANCINFSWMKFYSFFYTSSLSVHSTDMEYGVIFFVSNNQPHASNRLTQKLWSRWKTLSLLIQSNKIYIISFKVESTTVMLDIDGLCRVSKHLLSQNCKQLEVDHSNVGLTIDFCAFLNVSSLKKIVHNSCFQKVKWSLRHVRKGSDAFLEHNYFKSSQDSFHQRLFSCHYLTADQSVQAGSDLGGGFDQQLC